MSISFRVSVAAAVFAAATAGSASATVVADQPGYTNGSAVMSSDYIRSFDDFILSGNYTITTVSWTGNTTVPGATFEIGFTLADAAFPYYPNTALFSNQTVTPTASVIPSAPWNSTYTVTLPVSVDLMAGTGYWLSIYDSSDAYWSWGEGDGSATNGVEPPGIAASDLAGTLLLQGIDFAFTLEGTPTVPAPAVPEPLSLALFGAGLGFAGLRRRRR